MSLQPCAIPAAYILRKNRAALLMTLRLLTPPAPRTACVMTCDKSFYYGLSIRLAVLFVNNKGPQNAAFKGDDDAWVISITGSRVTLTAGFYGEQECG